MEEEENYLKRQRIYKTIMLVVLTAFLTFILTTIYISNKNGTNNGKQVNGIYDNETYEKGDKITINNSDTFSVSKTINIYGTKGR